MGTSTARMQDRAGRSIAAGAALLALAVGGMTMTDRALSATAAPGVVTSTLSVAGTSGVISDVNLKTQITHEYSRDLEILLTSPAGTTVAISTQSPAAEVPSNNIFSSATWNDQADDPVTDKTNFLDNGGPVILTPEAALGAFAGEDPDGNWTLTVRDVDYRAVGTLNGWGLDLQLASTGPSTTAEVFDAAPAAAIPDNAPGITGEIAVAGAVRSIWDVDLVTGIDHTAGKDLTVTLKSPSGTTALITSGNGFDKNVFNGVTFDDSAGLPTTRPVSDDAFDLPLPASLVPEGAMAQFKGEDPTGTWTLSVADGASGDVGTLASWGLRFRTVGSSPATTSTSRTSAVVQPIPDAKNPTPDPTPDPTPVPGPGAGGGTTPPPVGGGTPPPVVITKLTPRGLGVTLSTARDRLAPFGFTVTGKLTRPLGSTLCAGKVKVTLKAGKKVVRAKTVALRTVKANCTYRAAFRLKNKPAALPTSGRLSVSARFLGTARLAARASKVASVRLG